MKPEGGNPLHFFCSPPRSPLPDALHSRRPMCAVGWGDWRNTAPPPYHPGYRWSAYLSPDDPDRAIAPEVLPP